MLITFYTKHLLRTVIQVYALTSNAEEAEVEWFYEDVQDLLELTPKKYVLFITGHWNAKVGRELKSSQGEITFPGSPGQVEVGAGSPDSLPLSESSWWFWLQHLSHPRGFYSCSHQSPFPLPSPLQSIDWCRYHDLSPRLLATMFCLVFSRVTFMLTRLHEILQLLL